MRMRTVLLAALILVLGANIGAYAANGKPLLLGKVNKATKVTTVKNTRGPALNLRSRAGTPPLVVSSGTKVANLNADTIDGLDAAAFQSKAYTFTVPAAEGVASYKVNLPGVPAGKYVATYNVLLTVTGAGQTRCFFSNGAGSAFVQAHAATASTPFAASLNATGVVDGSTHHYLECLGGTFSVDPGLSNVTLVPLDTVVPATAVAAP